MGGSTSWTYSMITINFSKLSLDKIAKRFGIPAIQLTQETAKSEMKPQNIIDRKTCVNIGYVLIYSHMKI